MANFKISQLPVTSQIESNDILPIVDTSELETKKATVDQIKGFITQSVTELPNLIIDPEANFTDFTGSVRDQFTAGTNILISDGVISSTAASNITSITGSENIDITDEAGPIPAVSLKDTITGLASISSSGFTGSFTGSFAGDGSQLTNLTASQLSNFTTDVRAQFTAGSNVSIVDGVISSVGSGSGGGDITSIIAGTNLNGGGTAGDVTLNLNNTLTGLTSVTSTAFTGSFSGSHSGSHTGSFKGDGSQLANLNADNMSAGTLPVTRGGTGLNNLSGAGGNGVLVGNGNGLATALVGSTDGQVLKWNNTTKNWTAGTDNNTGGTVTSIATNNGITGGTITSTGTIGLTGQALALHNLTSSTGLISRTSAGVITTRTLATGTGITISDNGTGTGPITITNTAPGVNYSAGNGISIAGTTITNTAQSIVQAFSSPYASNFSLATAPTTNGTSYNLTLNNDPTYDGATIIKQATSVNTTRPALTITSSINQSALTIDASSSVITIPAVRIINRGIGNSFEVFDQASDTTVFSITNVGGVLVGFPTPNSFSGLPSSSIVDLSIVNSGSYYGKSISHSGSYVNTSTIVLSGASGVTASLGSTDYLAVVLSNAIINLPNANSCLGTEYTIRKGAAQVTSITVQVKPVSGQFFDGTLGFWPLIDNTKHETITVKAVNLGGAVGWISIAYNKTSPINTLALIPV
jgi:hypothetical protein